MKFEQAFYTRDEVKGLGIAASSNPEIAFTDKCLRVGSHFEIEPTERTAQFVYYSKDFRRYVGVGVSPSTYRDGRGMNKLVHIWVSQEDSPDPADYYLPYEFERKVDVSRKYEAKEYRAALGDEDFRRVLKKYGFDRDRLAGMMSKVFPVIFNEENLLAIVVSREIHDIENFPLLARELTWLFYKLIPVPDREKGRYGANLSYSVFSKVNISAVNIAYVEEEGLCRNYYIFDREHEENVPEVYYELAEYALNSKSAYDGFISELYSCRLEEQLTSKSLHLAFLRWKLDRKTLSLTEDSLPVPAISLINRGKREEKYRILLYLVVRSFRNCSSQTLADLAVQIFRPMQNKESDSPLYFEAYKNALKIAYAQNYQYYTVYIRDMRGEFRKQMEYELWNHTSKDSCIAEDIESINSGEEALSKLKLYQGLWDNDSFMSRMRAIVLENYYFQMDLDSRKEVSTILDREPDDENSIWKVSVREKVAEFFHIDKYIEFIEWEIGRTEAEYIPLYFTYFIRNCGKEENPAARDSLQKLGRRFLESYRDILNQQNIAEFEKLELGWIKKDLCRRMEPLSLEELSEFRDFGGYFGKYRRELIMEWFHLLLTHLDQEKISEMAMKNLVNRIDEIDCLGEECKKEYTDAVWNSCGNNIRWRVHCSALLGDIRYSIWDIITLGDIESYKEIFAAVMENGKYRLAEGGSAAGFCTGTAEFNRRCYLFWKQMFQKQKWSWNVFSEQDFNNYRGKFKDFLESLEKWMTDQKDSQTCLNYLHLERKKEMLWPEECRDSEARYSAYKELKQFHGEFYHALINTPELYADGQIIKSLREIKIFERLDERKEITEDNLEAMVGLLWEAENCFGKDALCIERLEKEFRRIMEELRDEQSEIQNQINSDTILMNDKMQQIQKLEKEVKVLEKRIENTTKRRDKLKNMRERAKAIRQGGISATDFVQDPTPYVHEKRVVPHTTPLHEETKRKTDADIQIGPSYSPAQGPLRIENNESGFNYGDAEKY